MPDSPELPEISALILLVEVAVVVSDEATVVVSVEAVVTAVSVLIPLEQDAVPETLDVSLAPARQESAEANSPEPEEEQKAQPPVPRVPSRFGHVKPASRESLMVFPPNVSFR